jgi:phosphatidate cytidylyltransferase
MVSVIDYRLQPPALPSNMLGTRLFFGLLMVAGLLFALWLDEWFAPWYPCWFLLAGFALVAASRELVSLLNATSAAPSGNSVIGGVLALLVSNWLPHVAVPAAPDERIFALSYDLSRPLNVLAWPFLTVVAVLMITFIVQSLQFDKPGRTMAKIAGTILVVTYLGLLGSFTIQMRWFEGSSQGMLALAYLIATAKGADTGAYTLGRLAGRHKLWPSLSPSKTIEGAVGGLVFGVAAALIVASVARFALHVPTFDWPTVVAYGFVVGAVAQLGDLMESMIKRDCQRKDASEVVPGFGGVLDVLDSIIFAGPVAYAFWLGFGS